MIQSITVTLLNNSKINFLKSSSFILNKTGWDQFQDCYSVYM
jgi:hypothetical protein